MTKKWLTCVFSYNRPVLLANVVQSLDEFFPWGDRLLLDDGSSDPRCHTLLEDIAKRPRWKCRTRDRHTQRSFGGFYVNMGIGLEYALENGYDYCFFVEDDEQFLWHKPDYPEYVDHVFDSCPDAIQMQPLFYRRIVSYNNILEHIKAANVYRSERGFSTTAIWNLNVVRRHPDYKFISAHGDDLPANSAYWLNKGYRLYMQFDPVLAVMPWVQSQSEQPVQLSNEFAPKKDRFLLPPLEKEQISFLQERTPELLAYQEYFTRTANNEGVRPIWHQHNQNLNRYYALCRMTVEEEDRLGQSPTRIRLLNEWEPSKVPALQTHLTWNPYQPAEPVSPLRSKVAALASRLPQRLIDWRHFKPRDYWGYRILTQRLQKEIRDLPFRLTT